MKIKTSELTGPALDWAVAKCEGLHPNYLKGFAYEVEHRNKRTELYSSDWAQGGPIIEREGINLTWSILSAKKVIQWAATIPVYAEKQLGPTPLIAAMRRYIFLKLGEEIEIPEELL